MSNKQLLTSTAISQGGSFVVNAFRARGFNANALRTNDVLRKDQWEHFDAAVVETAKQRLVGVADLLSRGLTYDVPEPFGRTEIRWEKQSDMDGATRSMEGLTRGRNDRVEFSADVIPFYITHKDFKLSLRHLEASRKYGDPLDTVQVEQATRVVTEDLEDALFNGAAEVKLNGNSVTGYTTHPSRNTGNFESTGGAWTGSTKTGEQILADVLSMIAFAKVDRMYGPYGLYMPSTYYNVLQKDFKAGSDKSILTRLLEIPQLEFIKESDFIGSDSVVLIQLTRDVVDMAVGEEPTLVQWDSGGGFEINFKVLSIMVPRIKADYYGRSGIVHFTPSA